MAVGGRLTTWLQKNTAPGIHCCLELWLGKQNKWDKVPARHPLLHPVPHSDKAFPIQWQSPGCLEHKAGKGQHRHRSRNYLLQQGAWAKGRAACQDSQCWNKEDVLTTLGVEGEFPTTACRSLLNNNYRIRMIKIKNKHDGVLTHCSWSYDY